MSDFEFQVHGLAELERQLIGLGTRGARNAGKKAMRQAANVIKDETKRRAPIDSGNLKKNIRTHDHGTKGDTVTFTVDVTRKAFYGKFLEFGTVKMAAKPFMRPAAESKAEESVTVLGVVLGEAITIEALKTGRR